MQHDNKIDLATRKYTSRLIVERALARGWHITGFETNGAIFLLHIPGRTKPVQIFSSSPPGITYPASKIAGDKYITNQILGNAGLPVPEDYVYSLVGERDEKRLKAFLDKHKTIVVKPLDASHGKGVTVNIRTEQQLHAAIEEVRDLTDRDTLVIQQQVAGHDVRVLCIDYEYAGALSRIPASVIGDGTHNIRELIDITNSSHDRGLNYMARLNIIDTEKAEQYLGTEGMSEIPLDGTEVRVIGVANIGMGGERKIITGNVPQFMIDFATKAARLIELPVCAVDFMAEVEPYPGATQDDIKPYIIELNACPQLLIHEDPSSDEQKAFIDQYLDYIAKSSKLSGDDFDVRPDIL